MGIFVPTLIFPLSVIFLPVFRTYKIQYIKLQIPDIITATLSSGFATVETRSLHIEGTVRSLVRVSM
jgi:hypothetical protein